MYLQSKFEIKIITLAHRRNKWRQTLWCREVIKKNCPLFPITPLYSIGTVPTSLTRRTVRSCHAFVTTLLFTVPRLVARELSRPTKLSTVCASNFRAILIKQLTDSLPIVQFEGSRESHTTYLSAHTESLHCAHSHIFILIK